ncbi:hypothetical protein BK816_00540 [Boudabousia tangfeifanii]|uniref:Uncharacterized protein n=1 Tax=Boudabousia tangfeifanii TaxID=1912795 RepID=A0A1D9MI50_9ACTO|nr:lipase family protein [Boudabousia tangfeifanii]AOZ71964.1 hypothetical protein BK816_00540 [Boudabousia tangfeifanii]
MAGDDLGLDRVDSFTSGVGVMVSGGTFFRVDVPALTAMAKFLRSQEGQVQLALNLANRLGSEAHLRQSSLAALERRLALPVYQLSQAHLHTLVSRAQSAQLATIGAVTTCTQDLQHFLAHLHSFVDRLLALMGVLAEAEESARQNTASWVLNHQLVEQASALSGWEAKSRLGFSFFVARKSVLATEAIGQEKPELLARFLNDTSGFLLDNSGGWFSSALGRKGGSVAVPAVGLLGSYFTHDTSWQKGRVRSSLGRDAWPVETRRALVNASSLGATAGSFATNRDGEESPLLSNTQKFAGVLAQTASVLSWPSRGGHLESRILSFSGEQFERVSTPKTPGELVDRFSLADARLDSAELGLDRTVAGHVVVLRHQGPKGDSWSVLLPGTQTWRLGDASPQGLLSNLQVVAGQDSEQSEAVLSAMRQAGIRPGDPVELVGHSQGGAVALDLAARQQRLGEFQIGVVTTLGAPTGASALTLVAANQKGGQLPRILSLRNSRDLVTAMGGVQLPGAANHVVVSGNVPKDWAPKAHGQDGYRLIVKEAERLGDDNLNDFSDYRQRFLGLDQPGVKSSQILVENVRVGK